MSRKNRKAPLTAGGQFNGRRAYKAFSGFARPHLPGLILAFGLMVLGTVLKLAKPWPLALLVDQALTGPPRSDRSFGLMVVVVMASTVALALLDAGIGYFRSYLLQRVGQKVAFSIRFRLYEHMQRLSMSFHDGQQTGELMNRVTRDVDRVQELITDNLIEAASSTLLLAGMIGVTLSLDWRLSLVLMAMTPLMAVANQRFRRRIKSAEERARQGEGDMVSLTQETLSSMRIVKVFGREKHESDRFEEIGSETLDAYLALSRTESAFSSWLDIVPALAMAGLLGLGAQQVRSGELELGQLLVFVSYLKDFYGPTRALSKLAAKVSRAAVRAQRIAEVLETEPTVTSRQGAATAPRLRGEVTFSNVTFSYLQGRPVLRDVSLRVPAGSVLALVGTTGAGKSTLAALVPRLYDPDEGVVRVDGLDLCDLTLESLQSQVAVVPQESVLFRATVAENIAYGRPGASQREIEAAARAANAHDFIVGLPAGYETLIGERGDTLSGGQRQRIAIARALVRNAPVLILDEPTSGLDVRSEHVVLDAVERLMAGRTTIVIAHRLSTVRRADQIALVEAGCIVERGTHDELVALGGRYSELVALSSGDRLPVTPPPPGVAASGDRRRRTSPRAQ
ncbi:MAG: ABC transporter ATP-binding protein [Acidimicrobiia bacterium]